MGPPAGLGADPGRPRSRARERRRRRRRGDGRALAPRRAARRPPPSRSGSPRTARPPCHRTCGRRRRGPRSWSTQTDPWWPSPRPPLGDLPTPTPSRSAWASGSHKRRRTGARREGVASWRIIFVPGLDPGVSADPPHGQRTSRGTRGPQALAADRRSRRRRAGARPGRGRVRDVPLRTGERQPPPGRHHDRRRGRLGDDEGGGHRGGARARPSGSRPGDRRGRRRRTLHHDGARARPTDLGRPRRRPGDGRLRTGRLGRAGMASASGTIPSTWTSTCRSRGPEAWRASSAARRGR